MNLPEPPAKSKVKYKVVDGVLEMEFRGPPPPSCQILLLPLIALMTLLGISGRVAWHPAIALVAVGGVAGLYLLHVRRWRTTIKAGPAFLEVNVPWGPGRPRVTRIDAADLTVLKVSNFFLEKGLRDGLYKEPLEDEGPWWKLTRGAPPKPDFNPEVVALSDTQATAFGGGLTKEERKWMLAVLRETLGVKNV